MCAHKPTRIYHCISVGGCLGNILLLNSMLNTAVAQNASLQGCKNDRTLKLTCSRLYKHQKGSRDFLLSAATPFQRSLTD